MPIESSQLEDSSGLAAGFVRGPAAEIAGAPALNPIYDLRGGEASSDGYYAEVARFSDSILAEIERRAGAAVCGYGRYIQIEQSEAPRSQGEYAIDLLTLGMALSRYAGAAAVTPAWVVTVAQYLFALRRRSRWMKPAVDAVRGVVAGLWLAPGIGRSAVGGSATAGPRSVEQLPHLIAWLEATGELEQEALRLRNWHRYFDSLPRADATQCMETAAELFAWFEREADAALGAYTRGVPGFMAVAQRSGRCREDRILRGKAPVEYHLGMVAAEIMNRGLRSDFQRTPRRAVLVPTCMRGSHARHCRAHASGLDIVCTACDPECTVNRITRRMRKLGARVYLIPHATGFSRWLERWQRVPDCGVVAVACMLNILPGGYEIRARGIAAQCVPLDYPGCEKHWRRTGIPTDLNDGQLVHITTARST